MCSSVLLRPLPFPMLIRYIYTKWIWAKITSYLRYVGWGVRYEISEKDNRMEPPPQKEFGIFPYICNIHNIKVTATAFPDKVLVSYLMYLGLVNHPVAAPPISFF